MLCICYIYRSIQAILHFIGILMILLLSAQIGSSDFKTFNWFLFLFLRLLVIIILCMCHVQQPTISIPSPLRLLRWYHIIFIWYCCCCCCCRRSYYCFPSNFVTLIFFQSIHPLLKSMYGKSLLIHNQILSENLVDVNDLYGWYWCFRMYIFTVGLKQSFIVIFIY